MANSSSKSRIGLCVICGPLFIDKMVPELGVVGTILTNTPFDSEVSYKKCEACNGKGYTQFRSDK